MTPVCCLRCDQIFYSKSRYKQHKKEAGHPGRCCYICALCEQTFRSCDEWTRHCDETGHDGRFSDLSDGPRFRTHSKQPAFPPPETPPETPRCGTCTAAFSTFHELAEHRSTAHDNLPAKRTSRESHAKALGPVSVVGSHISIVAAVCQICGQRFGSVVGLEQHAIQNPLSCPTCAEHIQPGTSLEDHWRQSNKHPFCDRCERGFKDKQAFNAHTLVCALAVGELVPGSAGNPDLKGEILKSQARSGAGNEQADVQAEPNMRAAAIASECLTALSLHNSDDVSHSTSRGSSPATTSEGSDTIRPDEPVLSLSLLLSGPLSEVYNNKSTQLDTPRERADTLLANARREPAWQQQCLEHPFPPLSRKPDCQLHEARRENTQDTATATQLWSDIVANRNRPSNADAAGRVRVRSFLRARQDERPMLGERQERRQQPALDDEESASLSGSSPNPRTSTSEDESRVPPIGSVPSRPTILSLPRPHARTEVRPSARTNNHMCGACFSRPCADPVLTFCGHIFCKSCILFALRHKLKCPTCKKTYFTVLEP
ncbi:hypothetical protein PYCCODRAFT_1472988 [Trametes coccinea BRFM310]|uniref:RING-type domain-containing protein n=1 Tax=Trametes coccinea (strain BRFM310) TaxID=1353009 RepID=A0A1Y2J645_TRAC3|nr:hypothetical protein PYCCODRAFT_1472988 [Trametes coccinea BRFM310]